MIGSEGNVKVLPKTYQSKNSAYYYAKHWWQKLQRGAASFSLTLAHGRPYLFPELPIQVTGFKQEIDSTKWICTRCTHQLDNSSGYTPAIELELQLDDEEREPEVG